MKLRDAQDYRDRRRAIQDLQLDPATAQDPQVRREVMRRLADLNRAAREQLSPEDQEKLGLSEDVAIPKKCWPGYKKVGTKPGTGRNRGRRVNDCEKIDEQGVSEGSSLGKVLSFPDLVKQVKHILDAKHGFVGWKMSKRDDDVFLFSAMNDYDVRSMLVVAKDRDGWVSAANGIVDPYGEVEMFGEQELPMTLASASEIAEEAINIYHRIDLSDYADEEELGEQGVAEAGPFSYGAKKPRQGSVADLAAKKRKEQDKNYKPTEPKDQMVGTAKVTKGVAEGLEDSAVQQAIIDTVERLFRKNEIGDYSSLEAVRQGVKHHFSKPGATAESAIDGILNILTKRMSKSGNYVDLGRFKEALRQGVAHQLKKQGISEGRTKQDRAGAEAQQIKSVIQRLEQELKDAAPGSDRRADIERRLADNRRALEHYRDVLGEQDVSEGEEELKKQGAQVEARSPKRAGLVSDEDTVTKPRKNQIVKGSKVYHLLYGSGTVVDRSTGPAADHWAEVKFLSGPTRKVNIKSLRLEKQPDLSESSTEKTAEYYRRLARKHEADGQRGTRANMVYASRMAGRARRAAKMLDQGGTQEEAWQHYQGTDEQNVSEGYRQDALKKAKASRESRKGKPFEKNPLSHDKHGIYKGDKDLAGDPVTKEKKPSVDEGNRFSEPLTGYHIVYKNSGNPVLNTPSFETQDAAQKYLMTKMFANHQDYEVVHTANLGESDISGILGAASLVRDYIVTAEVDGREKKFRVRGVTGPRAARERFQKHHNQAKVISVDEEGRKDVQEGLAPGQAAWKKEMTAKGAVRFWRDQHGGGTVDRIIAYDKDGKVVGGFNRKGLAEESLGKYKVPCRQCGGTFLATGPKSLEGSRFSNCLYHKGNKRIDKLAPVDKKGKKQGLAEGEVSKKDIAVSKKKIDAKRTELEKQGVKKSQLGDPSYYLDAELRNANKKGVAEGYSLKKTNVSKYTEPGDPDEYTQDINVKDVDYEIINNKTGQVVGTASWTTNDFFGPGALKITMNNGATRWLDIWEREKGNPQSAFNRFVKDPKTSKKYVAEGQQTRKTTMKNKQQISEYRTLAGWQAAARKSGAQLVEGTRAVKEGILVGVWDGAAGQLLEGIEDKLEAAREKAAAKGRTVKGGEEEKSPVRKVAGHAYGGSKAKDEPTDDGDDDDTTPPSGGAPKKRGRPAGGTKKAAPAPAEPKRRGRPPGSGKKAAAAVPAAPKKRGRPRKVTEGLDGMHDPIIINGRAVDYHSIEVDGVDTRDYPDFSDAYIARASFVDGGPLSERDLDRLTARYPDLVHELAHEGLYEAKMTAAQKGKREDIVKSMKGDKEDFEKRYGKRGEEVMYATATKMAKKAVKESRESKPDFLDLDKDGDEEEPTKKAAQDAKDERTDESLDQIKQLAGLTNTHKNANTLMTKYTVSEGVVDAVKGLFGAGDKKDAGKTAEKPVDTIATSRTRQIDQALQDAGVNESEQGVVEGSAADDSVNYTLGHPVDKDYVYHIIRDGEKEGTYHSLDQAKRIVANMKKTNRDSTYKITRSARSKMAGPKGQLPESGVSEGSVLKSIKRGLQGWGGAEDDPKTLVKRNRAHDDETVKSLAKGEPGPKGSPRGLQKRVLDREMRKRGLGEEGVVEGVNEDVSLNITANGEEDVVKMVQKLAGMPTIIVPGHTEPAPSSGCAMADAMSAMSEEYDNSPDETVYGVDTQINTGSDLNRPKTQHANMPKAGDNPLATMEGIWRRYQDMIKGADK